MAHCGEPSRGTAERASVCVDLRSRGKKTPRPAPSLNRQSPRPLGSPIRVLPATACGQRLRGFLAAPPGSQLAEVLSQRGRGKPVLASDLQYQVRPGANFRSIGSPGHADSMRALTPVKEACGSACSFARHRELCDTSTGARGSSSFNEGEEHQVAVLQQDLDGIAHSSRGSSRMNLPVRRSSSVCSISARVFITNGP